MNAKIQDLRNNYVFMNQGFNRNEKPPLLHIFSEILEYKKNELSHFIEGISSNYIENQIVSSEQTKKYSDFNDDSRLFFDLIDIFGSSSSSNHQLEFAQLAIKNNLLQTNALLASFETFGCSSRQA